MLHFLFLNKFTLLLSLVFFLIVFRYFCFFSNILIIFSIRYKALITVKYIPNINTDMTMLQVDTVGLQATYLTTFFFFLTSCISLPVI